MLTANTKLDVRTGLATAFNTDLDQFTDTLAVNCYEWIGWQNTLCGV